MMKKKARASVQKSSSSATSSSATFTTTQTTSSEKNFRQIIASNATNTKISTGCVFLLTLLIVSAVFMTENTQSYSENENRTPRAAFGLNEDKEEYFDPETFTLPVYLPPSPTAPNAPPAPKIAQSKHDWSREQYDVAKEMNDGESLRALAVKFSAV